MNGIKKSDFQLKETGRVNKVLAKVPNFINRVLKDQETVCNIEQVNSVFFFFNFIIFTSFWFLLKSNNKLNKFISNVLFLDFEKVNNF